MKRPNYIYIIPISPLYFYLLTLKVKDIPNQLKMHGGSESFFVMISWRYLA
jgi:hypothetical protein